MIFDCEAPVVEKAFPAWGAARRDTVRAARALELASIFLFLAAGKLKVEHREQRAESREQRGRNYAGRNVQKIHSIWDESMGEHGAAKCNVQ